MARMVSASARQIAPANLEWTSHAEWLRLRREGLGGSDIPPVMGAKNYGRTRWQVWLDKTGGIPDEEMSPRQAEMIRFGHRMEAVAAAEWADRFPGTRLRRVGMLARADAPWMRVNIDRIMYGCPDGDGPCPWECKNRNAYTSREWDTAGDPDNIPDAPVLQVQWAVLILGYTHGHIAAVIGGNELRPYRVDADPELHKLMRQEAEWFWHDHVLPKVAPPVDASERTGHLLARLWDTDLDKVIVADASVVGRVIALHSAAERLGVWTEEAKRLQHELQAWMGDAEVCTDSEGRVLFTWKQNGPFREAAFRDEEPVTWASYARLVRVTDTGKLQAEEPATYRAWRARTWKLKNLPEGTG